MQPVARSSESEVEYDSEEETDLDTSEPDLALSARIKRLETEIEVLENNNDIKAAKVAYFQHLCNKLTENTNGLRTQLEAWAQKKKQLEFKNEYLVAENRHYIPLHQQQLMLVQPYQPSQPGGEAARGEGAEAAPDDHVDTVANQDAAARPEGDAAG